MALVEPSPSWPEAPLLELDRVGVAYGAVQALRDVSLAVRPGEVLGLCGDNGAGKSTLVKLIAGAHGASSGEMRWQGRPVAFASPRQALESGIATIYQDLALALKLPVWQNLFLGCELVRRHPLLRLPVLDVPAMRAESRAILGRLAIRVPDPDQEVAGLSGGQRQAVAIARALRWQAKLLVMDEPTAALGVRETGEVLELIRDLSRQGVTILVVSHDMADVVQVAQRVAILKKGRLATIRDTAGLDADALAHLVMTAEAA